MKNTTPDEISATDLMYMTIGGVQFFLVNVIDAYSRYLVHWELLTNMERHSINIAAQRALETLDHDGSGELPWHLLTFHRAGDVAPFSDRHQRHQ